MVPTQTGLHKNGPSPCLDQESDPWSPLSFDRQRSGLNRPMNTAPVVNTYDNDLQSSVLEGQRTTLEKDSHCGSLRL